MKKRFLPFLLLILFFSCQEAQRPGKGKPAADSISTPPRLTNDSIAEALYESQLIPGQKVPLNKIFTDTVTYVERDDNGDHFLFSIRKENRQVSLVYDDLIEKKSELLRGDTLAIQWKMDSIWIAGDEDRLDFKERLVDVKKIRDSKIMVFRKSYTRPLKYWYGKDVDYTDEFKDYLYRLVEYYIAYSKQPLLLLHLKNPDQTDFVYSIEERDEKGRHYIVLGLSNDHGTHSTIIQWLYLDSETHAFYEYDLANDKLIPLH